MICTEDIAGFIALRALFAAYSAELDDRARCEVVTDAELDERRFFYNAIDFLGSKICLDGMSHKLTLTFESDFESTSGPTVGALSILDSSLGEVANLTVFATTAQEAARNIYEGILFTIGPTSPIPGRSLLVDSVSLRGNVVEVSFSRGASGTFAFNKLPSQPVPGKDLNIQGQSPTTTLFDQGQLVNCGDCNSMKDVINILYSRLKLKCSKKYQLRYVGPCPPDQYIPCNLLGSGLVTAKFFGASVPNPGYSPTLPFSEITAPIADAHIYYIDLDVVSPLVSISVLASSLLYVKDLANNDVYSLRWVTDPTYPRRFMIQTVTPGNVPPTVGADDILIQDGHSLQIFGDFRVKTTKGNECIFPVNIVVEASQLKIPTIPDLVYANAGYQFKAQPQGVGIQLINFALPSPSNPAGIFGDPSLSIVPGKIVLFRTAAGVVIYEWVTGIDPLLQAFSAPVSYGENGDAVNVIFNLPNTLPLLSLGDYELVVPFDSFRNEFGKPNQALTLPFSQVGTGASAGFTYDFPFNLA